MELVIVFVLMLWAGIAVLWHSERRDRRNVLVRKLSDLEWNMSHLRIRAIRSTDTTERFFAIRDLLRLEVKRRDMAAWLDRVS